MMTVREAAALLSKAKDQDALIHDRAAGYIRKIAKNDLDVVRITWDEERKRELAGLFSRGYNVTDAAKHFGIARQVLWRAIKLHSLVAPSGRQSVARLPT